MSMTEILERDRERILSDLSGGKTPAETVPVLTGALDRILIRYNSDEQLPARRDAAAHMIEALKAFAPAADCIGNTKLWERSDVSGETAKRKADGFVIVLLIAGLLSAAGATVAMMFSEASALLPKLMDKFAQVLYALPGLSAVLMLLAGLRIAKGKKSAPRKKEQKVEVFADAEKIYRILHACMLVTDRELDLIKPYAPEQDAQDEVSRDLSDTELELYASILEAGYASEDEVMRECVENLRYYLHKAGIETEDYSQENKAQFELMPGQSAATVRPALVKDGLLLRRGLATDN